ncbi:hypothetical protein ABIE45_001264 [Methylobacterium sp. OAE515]
MEIRSRMSTWHRRSKLSCAVGIGLLCGGVALAQPDQTGTGGGPLSTETAPYTTSTGRTKPPSRDASPTARDLPVKRSKDDVDMDKIDMSICIGCLPKR